MIACNYVKRKSLFQGHNENVFRDCAIDILTFTRMEDSQLLHKFSLTHNENISIL